MKAPRKSYRCAPGGYLLMSRSSTESWLEPTTRVPMSLYPCNHLENDARPLVITPPTTRQGSVDHSLNNTPRFCDHTPVKPGRGLSTHALAITHITAALTPYPQACGTLPCTVLSRGIRCDRQNAVPQQHTWCCFLSISTRYPRGVLSCVLHGILLVAPTPG